MATNVKQFLDKAGVEALWDRIYNGFAPRWQSYKPSNAASSDEDKLPADFINTYESDHIVNGAKDGRKSLDIAFVSAGAIKDAQGNKYGRDLVIQIPEVKSPSSATAGDGKYGVMSPTDKWKLDHVGSTAEDAVTIKGVKVDGTELTLTNKFVNWKLNYDTSTNELQIVDLNSSSSAVLSRVDMDSILPDVITKGFLQNATITNEDGTGNKGLFLKLTFAISLNNGTVTNATDVYISVNDLIDVYNAGTGISVTQSTEPTADGTARTSTINLKPAATNEIGGIKIAADNSTTDNTSSLRKESATGRNFGVMTNKDDVAYVNVPVDTLEVDTSTIADDSIAIATADSFQVLAGYAKSASTDGNGWKLTPTYKTISVNKETDVTISGNTGSDTKTLTWGGTFDILKTVTTGGTNGHTLTRTKSTMTMPTETTLSLGTATADTNTISITPDVGTATVNSVANVPVGKYTGSFNTTAVSAVNGHTVTNKTTTHSFELQIPAIETAFIDALVYRVN